MLTSRPQSGEIFVAKWETMGFEVQRTAILRCAAPQSLKCYGFYKYFGALHLFFNA
ncbi:MAG: hypothetical protein IPM82_14255 [Saprospiraceae bacterium]|nr:hypothetical protein [Saprospiraceae bacterium]